MTTEPLTNLNNCKSDTLKPGRQTSPAKIPGAAASYTDANLTVQ